ncbi:hypothetical protein MferCBS31731_003471 [Microsporum ferrugineum]
MPFSPNPFHPGQISTAYMRGDDGQVLDAYYEATPNHSAPRSPASSYHSAYGVPLLDSSYYTNSYATELSDRTKALNIGPSPSLSTSYPPRYGPGRVTNRYRRGFEEYNDGNLPQAKFRDAPETGWLSSSAPQDGDQGYREGEYQNFLPDSGMGRDYYPPDGYKAASAQFDAAAKCYNYSRQQLVYNSKYDAASGYGQGDRFTRENHGLLEPLAGFAETNAELEANARDEFGKSHIGRVNYDTLAGHNHQIRQLNAARINFEGHKETHERYKVEYVPPRRRDRGGRRGTLYEE